MKRLVKLISALAIVLLTFYQFSSQAGNNIIENNIKAIAGSGDYDSCYEVPGCVQWNREICCEFPEDHYFFFGDVWGA